MNDTISREKALNTVSFMRQCCDTNDIDDYANMIVEAFKVLPPAQTTKIQDILNYIDTELYPIISIEHWHIYSELYDMVSILQPTQQTDIDEWLPEKCELLDACPNPGGVACWKQYLKHRKEVNE